MVKKKYIMQNSTNSNNNILALKKSLTKSLKKKTEHTLVYKLNINFFFKLKNTKLSFKYYVVNKQFFWNYYLNRNTFHSVKKPIYKFLTFLYCLKIINLNLIELNYSLFTFTANKLHIILTNNKVFKNKIKTIISPIIAFNSIHNNIFNYSICVMFALIVQNKIYTFSYKPFNLLLQKTIYTFYFNFSKNYVIPSAKLTVLHIHLYKFLASFLISRKINKITPTLLKFFLLKSNKKTINSLKFLLWKTNSNSLKSNFLSYLYFLQRFEEKFDSLNIANKDASEIKKLNDLRNLFYIFFDKKKYSIKTKKYLIVNQHKRKEFVLIPHKNREIRFLNLKKKIFAFLKKNRNSSFNFKFKKIKMKKIGNFIIPFVKRFPFKSYRIPYVKNGLRYCVRKLNGNIHCFTKKNKRTKKKIRGRVYYLKWKKPFKYKLKFFNKKLVYNNIYFNHKYNQELISLLFGFKVNIYFINALSITRFDFNIHMEKKKTLLKRKRSALIFIQRLEREFISRYKFVANYLQDFARVGFISLYTKDFQFLVKFIAFQISNLQKNRKETRLIQFLIKAIKIFSAQRKEILGLKIEFKGRVNRWRRTKIIKGVRSTIPYNSYSTRLEYATATAITRKGTLGIRLWIYYDFTIDTGYWRYIKANKLLKYKQFQNNFIY